MAENIVRIHRPELTPEERARRMRLIGEAAAELILSAAIARKEHNNGTNDRNP